DLTVEQGRESARLVAINLIAMARAELGTLDRVERVVRLAGYVNAVPGFGEAPSVINGASDLLIEVFGEEKGTHARISLAQPDLHQRSGHPAATQENGSCDGVGCVLCGDCQPSPRTQVAALADGTRLLACAACAPLLADEDPFDLINLAQATVPHHCQTHRPA